MPITKEIIEKVAADTGITMDKLPVSGLSRTPPRQEA